MVGKQRRQIQIVHDGEHAAPALGVVGGDPHDLKLMLDVETGNRFVQKQVARHSIRNGFPYLA